MLEQIRRCPLVVQLLRVVGVTTIVTPFRRDPSSARENPESRERVAKYQI